MICNGSELATGILTNVAN